MVYDEYKFNGQVCYGMPSYPAVVGMIQGSSSSSPGGLSVPGLDRHKYGSFFHCEVNERRRINHGCFAKLGPLQGFNFFNTIH